MAPNVVMFYRIFDIRMAPVGSMFQSIVSNYRFRKFKTIPKRHTPWTDIDSVHLQLMHQTQLNIYIYNILVPTHHIRSVALNQLHSKFKGLRMYEIVRIHKHNILGIGESHTFISSMRESTIFLMNHHKARVFCCILFKDSRTSVCRTIINTNGTPMSVCLFEDTIKTTTQVWFNVINRNNNIYSVSIHNCLSVIYDCVCLQS